MEGQTRRKGTARRVRIGEGGTNMTENVGEEA